MDSSSQGDAVMEAARTPALASSLTDAEQFALRTCADKREGAQVDILGSVRNHRLRPGGGRLVDARRS